MSTGMNALLRGRVTRRALLQAGALGAIAIAGQTTRSPATTQMLTTQAIPDMAPFDVSTIDRSLFSTQEQGIVQYLASLAAVANNMEDVDQATLGWFHRGYQVYAPDPWNARNQESVYTLAFFYTYDAPWNPYYLDPVLREHVYASMRYYMSLQGAEGWWPAYSYTDRNRAATGFALVYLGDSLLLMDSVGWDPALRAQVLASLQRGAEYMLDPAVTDVWSVGVRFSNQIIGAMVGIAGFLHLLPAELKARFDERLDFLTAHGQSAGTGYLYEDGAFDGHYSLYTSLRDLAIGYERTGDDRFRQMALRHLDWCQYNYLWEPDGAGWTVNGISTRQSMRSLPALRNSDASNYPDHLNLFKESAVERALNWNAEHVASLQAAWAAGDVEIAPLAPSALSPQNLRMTEIEPVFPTLAERHAAIASLRYLAVDAFVEERSDTTYDAHYLFVKRAGYYFGAHYGTARAAAVRRGPSFFYTPEAGALIATQMGTDSAWTTVLPDGVMDAKTSVQHTAGTTDPTQPFSVEYTGASGRVKRSITCGPQGVEISVHTPRDASFTERVPLVVRLDDTVTFLTDSGEIPASAGAPVMARGLRLRRPGSKFDLTIDGDLPVPMRFTPTSVALFSGSQKRTVTNLDMDSAGSTLTYRVHLHS